jgi:hypothetical protein
MHHTNLICSGIIFLFKFDMERGKIYNEPEKNKKGGIFWRDGKD